MDEDHDGGEVEDLDPHPVDLGKARGDAENGKEEEQGEGPERHPSLEIANTG